MTDKKPVNCGCGGEAFAYNVVPNYAWFAVRCASCGTETTSFHTETEAIEAWNRAMGVDKVDELMEHIWRDKLDTREKIANLVERMLK